MIKNKEKSQKIKVDTGSQFVKYFERELMHSSDNYPYSIELIKKNVYKPDLEILRPLALSRIVRDGTPLEQAALLTMCKKLNTTPQDIPKEDLYYMLFVMNISVMSYPIIQNKDFSINMEYYDTSDPLKVLKLFQIFDSKTMQPVRIEVPSIVNLILLPKKQLQIRALKEEDIYYAEFFENQLKNKRRTQ